VFDEIPQPKNTLNLIVLIRSGWEFYSIFILLLINAIWLATATMNDEVCELRGMVNLVSDVVSVLVIIVRIKCLLSK
jgi:hypothetical protein